MEVKPDPQRSSTLGGSKHFMEAQEYTIEDNILHQDNKSTILLQENGRKSAGKQREL